MESCGGGEGEARKRGRLKDTGGEREREREGEQGAPAAAKRGRTAPAWAPHPQPASRIYRVSRASGGKDRHSKVYTAKGIRDRRVRLSVATAIQFYDLQDRLGYDQPSKAIEWLIKAAADAIDKLPELHNNFPAHPASSLLPTTTTLPPGGGDANNNNNSSNSKEEEDETKQRSGCSSTSETSKGSVLSLSRSESRVKARERARERSAAAKDPAAPAPATSSFTELLTGMSAAAADQHKQPPTSSWATADYIGFAPRKSSSSALPHVFASPAPHLAGGNIPMAPTAQQHFGLSPAGAVTVASAEMTPFSFMQQDHHFMPAAGAGDYNLNFSMSSGGGGLVMGVNSRGTLQSNSHISAHHHQLSSTPPLDAPPNIPFLFTPAPTAADTQFAAAAAFQLWNGFHHHADIKDKGKN